MLCTFLRQIFFCVCFISKHPDLWSELWFISSHLVVLDALNHLRSFEARDYILGREQLLWCTLNVLCRLVFVKQKGVHVVTKCIPGDCSRQAIRSGPRRVHYERKCHKFLCLYLPCFCRRIWTIARITRNSGYEMRDAVLRHCCHNVRLGKRVLRLLK